MSGAKANTIAGKDISGWVMKMRKAIAVAIVLLSVSAVCAERVTIELAEAGHPSATIVIPAEAHARERLAAEELAEYVANICGVELPINSDGRQVDGTGLYIGDCEPTQDSDLPSRDLNPESWAIQVRDGNVYFNGRHPTPTYFAVASFIEDVLGVRWFAPTETWQYVPEGTPGELRVQVSSVVSVPDTSPRIWTGHGWTSEWARWNLRNKTVQSEVVPRRAFQNYMHRVLPPSEYAESNPEFYPLIDGERWIPPDDESRRWRPCESNPEVQRIVAEYARRVFDENPQQDSFSLGMDDIWYMCACDDCRAWDPHPDSYERRQFSDRHYKFVNIIARQIAESHPDRYIGTLIYSIARDLPEEVDRLEDNVFGWITQTSARWYDPEIKRRDQHLTRQWAQRCQHLSRYDYYGLGGCTPRVFTRAAEEALRLDKSLGFEGMYIEVYTFLPNTAPMIWATAKMQWDASLSMQPLLDEFCGRMFGAAADTMREYFDLLERSWMTNRPGRTRWVHRDLHMQALAMSAEDVDAAFALLRQATAQSDDDLVRERIRTVREGLRYGSFIIRTLALADQMAAASITNESQAQAVLEMTARMGRLSRERERHWAAAQRRPDLLGDTVRGLGSLARPHLPVEQIGGLESPAWTAALQAMMWYADNAPERLRPMVAELVADTPSDRFEQIATDLLWISESQPENMLVNGDFADTEPSEVAAEHDWQTEGAPAGWTRWTRGGLGNFMVVPGAGRDGTNAVAMTGVDSASFLQPVQVQPGERYLAIAWAKGENLSAASTCRLGLRWQTPDGSWHPRRELDERVHLPGDREGWQAMMLVVTVPEDAGHMVVMPGAGRIPDDGRMLFDEILVYRWPGE